MQAFTAAVSCSGFTTGLAEVLLSSAATHAATVGARVGVGTGRSVKEGAFFGAKKAITSLFVAGRNCNCSESPSGADLGMAVGGADLGMAVGGFARAGVTAVDAAALATAKLPWSGVAAVVAGKLPWSGVAALVAGKLPWSGVAALVAGKLAWSAVAALVARKLPW